MNTEGKKNIRNCSLEDISVFFNQNGEKPFRARQVYQWLWEKSAHSFEEMTNISKSVRDLLDQKFYIDCITTLDTQISNDGTIKNAFRLYDGNIVEGVLIPADERMTACVSSQVGCSLDCKFCATAALERIRNLDAGEIYDQVVLIARQALKQYQIPLSNIVYMGMGEPLLNYKNVLQSIEHITSPAGLNMSPKRITVSTAGIAKMIRKLGDDEVRFNLALSLHAANDLKRSKIMPINESNSLEEIFSALKHYYSKTSNPVTFEYIIFKDFNDSLQDAAELYALCKKLPCKVNIIEYNPVAGSNFEKADENKTDAFLKYLDDRNIIARIRRSRGKDIDAACGQLANIHVVNNNVSK